MSFNDINFCVSAIYLLFCCVQEFCPDLVFSVWEDFSLSMPKDVNIPPEMLSNPLLGVWLVWAGFC